MYILYLSCVDLPSFFGLVFWYIKVLLFCEGEPSKKASNTIKLISKNLNIYTIRINLKNYVKRNNNQYLKKFPGASNCEDYFSLGYRDMCKFFANDVFYDQHFDDTEYFIRMDTDSFFLNVRKIFF